MCLYVCMYVCVCVCVCVRESMGMCAFFYGCMDSMRAGMDCLCVCAYVHVKVCVCVWWVE